MTQYFGLVDDMLTLYLTATSGYLVVAYLAGANLNRALFLIIPGLEIVFAISASYLPIGYGMRGLHYASVLASISPSTPLYSTNAIPLAFAVALSGGIIACMKFMWDVRHHRA